MADKREKIKLRTVLPGVSLAAVIAAVAHGMNQLPFAPFTVQGEHPLQSVLIAIVLGLLISNLLRLPKSIGPGAKYCLKSLLAFGIVLMGSRLDFFDVLMLGGLSVGLVLAVIVVALSLSTWLGRMLRLEPKLGALIAVGCTICGGSAVAATAPVIEAEDKDVAFAVGSITILGVAAMLVYPVIGGLIHLTSSGFGIWAGTAIHNTPQVVAAGMMWSPEAMKVATTVKMTRNLFIAPVVILFGFLFRARRQAGRDVKLDWRELLPMFVLGFVLMAALRTVMTHAGLVGSEEEPRVLWPLFQWFNIASVLVITTAMAGIGLTTNLAEMKKLGVKGFSAALMTTIIVAIVSALLIFGFHLNAETLAMGK